MPVITLVNGKQRIYKDIISIIELSEDIKPGLSKISVGALVNGHFVNMNFIIVHDAHVFIFTMKDNKTINLIRYSCVQLLSYACKKKWPKSKIGIGNIEKNGFYCDIDIGLKINNRDIIELEKLMHKLINKKYDIIPKKILKKDLQEIFSDQSENYKLDYINKNTYVNNLIDIYYHENYIDINLGSQVSNIQFCSYFKLQNLSGAYWEGKNTNKMLQRIYGTSWLNNFQMLKFFNNIKIMKNKDHRILNKKMNLYHFQEESPGMIFWHNNGLIIFRELENFIRLQLQKWKYQEVKTPLMLNESIWRTSGHIENFENSIFTVILENQKYCIKPMNCPAHIQVFNHNLKSYRDLPIRIAEFGVCNRYETSGSLHGLMRLRSFTQDDAHIFCTENQLQNEIQNCIEMICDIYKIFGFKRIHVKFSTRPKKRIGSDKIWDQAEWNLKNALLKSKIDFQYQIGEGAFYGPKIEFILEDCLKRLWQCGTIQLDFYLPHRFGSYYIDDKNSRQVPIMIHRAILGSIERFIGILLEEYSGFLPLWLSPIQVVIVNINVNHIQYVKNLTNKMLLLGIRIKSDITNEKINFKIRKYSIQRIPYILICGDKEVSLNNISVRNNINNTIKILDVDFFIQQLKLEIINRNVNIMEE